MTGQVNFPPTPTPLPAFSPLSLFLYCFLVVVFLFYVAYIKTPKLWSARVTVHSNNMVRFKKKHLKKSNYALKRRPEEAEAEENNVVSSASASSGLCFIQTTKHGEQEGEIG